jgi:hypothetical protein
MQHDNGWIEKLLHEAENERMHLMIWMAVTHPTWLERCLVTFVQGLFFNAYILYYLVFPRTAHRFVLFKNELNGLLAFLKRAVFFCFLTVSVVLTYLLINL